eukprot:4960988-Amphidinium_carterae.1
MLSVGVAEVKSYRARVLDEAGCDVAYGSVAGVGDRVAFTSWHGLGGPRSPSMLLQGPRFGCRRIVAEVVWCKTLDEVERKWLTCPSSFEEVNSLLVDAGPCWVPRLQPSRRFVIVQGEKDQKVRCIDGLSEFHVKECVGYMDRLDVSGVDEVFDLTNLKHFVKARFDCLQGSSSSSLCIVIFARCRILWVVVGTFSRHTNDYPSVTATGN